MKLIIFDVDGTLVYSNKIDSQCFAETYEAVYGRPFPTIDWRKYPHVSDTTIFDTVIQQHFQRRPDRAEMDNFCDQFVARIGEKRKSDPHEFMEVPGARQAIDQLRARGDCMLGIATGGWERPARLKLAHVGITLDTIFFSGADGHWTREMIIESVLAPAYQAHSGIEKVVYIGDAIWDVTTTRNMNMNFVGIRREMDHEVLLMAGATQVLPNFENFDHFWQAIELSSPPQ
ncbi:MAG: HAD hydrolase-like protein [Saprospiraceae bacterium]